MSHESVGDWNATATREALGIAAGFASLFILLASVVLYVVLFLVLRHFLLRWLGVKTLRAAIMLLAGGNAARRRRVERHHLHIRGPHYRELGARKPKARVTVERRPKDPSGGVRP